MSNTGYLVLDNPITVLYDPPVGKRSFSVGVNKDVTPEMADHWYVKANGGRYITKLEDAHKNTPEIRRSASLARTNWETAARAAIQAGIQAESMRQDLVRVEKEFGISTKELDKTFEASMEEERARYEELQASAQEADDEQKRQDAATSPSPAETERRAAGSEEVANTQMDGPAKEDAEKTAVANVPAPGQPQGAPVAAKDPGPSPETIKAAGSAESANTKSDGQPAPGAKVDTAEEAAAKKPDASKK